MSRYHVAASWNETDSHETDSLDEADAWAHAVLSEHPEASVYVASDDFAGSWFTPRPPRRPSAAKREHEAGHRAP